MSAATVVQGPDDLAPLVGAALGSSGWLTVNQVEIDAFATLTRDEQWIHVDPARAAAGPYGSTIAHGYLTLSLCSHFLEQILAVEAASMTINYGLDRVRFPAPVPVGSRLRGHGRLLSLKEVEGGVEVVVEVTVEVEGGPKPACVASTVIRFYR